MEKTILEKNEAFSSFSPQHGPQLIFLHQRQSDAELCVTSFFAGCFYIFILLFVKICQKALIVKLSHVRAMYIAINWLFEEEECGDVISVSNFLKWRLDSRQKYFKIKLNLTWIDFDHQ